MSGSTIGGLAGAAIGFFVPFIGPALGASIGSAVGGLIAPTTIKGPSIGEPTRTTVQPGLPRPKAYGLAPPFPGTVIDGEKIARKVTKKTKQGKGGPTVKEDKFLLTSAIGCGEPGEIIWIEYDGVVVLDRRPPEMLPDGWEGYSKEVKVAQKKFLENARIYNGSEDQLPDPALEAIHGVGNTPAFRGTSYFVHENADRTITKGTAGQYRVMVASCASPMEAPSFEGLGPDFWFIGNTSPAVDEEGNANDMALLGSAVSGGLGVSFPTDLNAGTSAVSGTALVDGPTSATIMICFQVDDHDVGGSVMRNVLSFWTNNVLAYGFWSLQLKGPNNLTPYAEIHNLGGAGESLLADFEVPIGRPVMMGLRVDEDRFDLIYGGQVVASRSCTIAALGGSAAQLLTGGAVFGSSYGYLGSWGNAIGIGRALSDDELITAAFLMGVVPDGFEEMPDAPGSYYNPDTGEIIVPGHSSSELCDVSLQEIEEDIADRCGVPSDKIDCSALAGIVVPGYLIGSQSPGRDCLEPLMLSFFHDLPEIDGRIVARLRGGPTVFDITSGMLLLGTDDDQKIRPETIEFPRKVSVITKEPEANYNDIPQTSVRFSPDVPVTGEFSVALPIPFPADMAMKIAVKLHSVLWSKAEGQTKLSLPPDFASMVASDPFNFDNRRWLCTKTDYANGELDIEAEYERASNFDDPNVSGTPPPTPAPPGGSVKGPTYFAAMNLPRLRTQDNSPGAYLAITGVFTGYEGADIYLSIDDGVSYQLVTTITRESIMGRVVEDEPSAGEPITVRLWDSTDELENVTADQVLLGANAAALLHDDDTAEIIGFETANQVTSGDWELTDITRGGLGTDEVPATTGQRFVQLDQVTFLPLDASLAGKVLKFRAVTIGTPVDSNPVIDFLFLPQFTGPEVIDFLETKAGEILTTKSGTYIQVTHA